MDMPLHEEWQLQAARLVAEPLLPPAIQRCGAQVDQRDTAKKKVAILTLPISSNYGWALQLWALYTFLRQQGYDVKVLQRRWNDPAPSLRKDCLRAVLDHTSRRPFVGFMRNTMLMTPVLRSSQAMHDVVEKEHFDYIVIGSDQVWRIEHTRGADLNYFGDFLHGLNVWPLAYAASFGTDKWAGDTQETAAVRQLLKRFSLVSVRESTGVDICKQEFGITAHHVIDPTMLVDERSYSGIMKKMTVRKPFVAHYILDMTQWKHRLIERVAETKQLAVKSLMPARRTWHTRYRGVGDWLSLIDAAEYVVTDSFHGMVFCILFRKQFVVIANEHRGLTRFESILQQLGLKNRLAFDIQPESAVIQKLLSPIDYNSVFILLSKLRSLSRQLLISSLQRNDNEQ